MAERRGTRLLVFVDGHCPWCRAAGRWLGRLAAPGRLEVRSYRDDASYGRFHLTLDAVDRELHVVELAGGGALVRRGYAAVTLLARRLPALWPLLPVLWVGRLVGLGPALYRLLAARRCRGGRCRWRGAPPPRRREGLGREHGTSGCRR